MASAQGWGALVRHADVGDKLIPLKPQCDTRFVAVSPDGEWVATGSHEHTGVPVKIWEARTGRCIADLPVEGSSVVGFSPNGRWLLTTGGGYRLWAVGTWQEGAKIGGSVSFGAFAFSPDSKILAVEAGGGAVELVDPDSGREYARLEDPNQDRAFALTFSQDGSQLVATTKDSPAVHVWDLRAIRAKLAKRDFDWALPPYPPADERKHAPLQVTVGSEDQAFAHVKLGQWEEAASRYALLAESNPDEHWYWFRSAPLCLQTGNVEGFRRACREILMRFGNTDKPDVAVRTAIVCSLVPEAVSGFAPVLKLADRSVTGAEKHRFYHRWFVLIKGLAEYRAGHYAVAGDWLNRLSLRADGDYRDATAFAVLAMTKHQLSLAQEEHTPRLAEEARAALKQAQAILSKMPDPKAGRPYGQRWPLSVDTFNDWLSARILVRETEKLLEEVEK
jgi:tetratricopeptide (TPR) repeat protein